MLCSKCIYYAPLVARSYDLSKCLKLQLFANIAIKKCNGELFSPKKFIRSNESKRSNTIINEIKNKDNR